MRFLDKLLNRRKPLTWVPPVAPSRDASLDAKLDWLESCNEDVADRLGYSILRIAQAFSCCERMMQVLAALAEIDMILSRRKADDLARGSAIYEAIRQSGMSQENQEIVFYYWQVFGAAYDLIFSDNLFVSKIKMMSNKFDMMPHIFTQGVLELACVMQKK